MTELSKNAESNNLVKPLLQAVFLAPYLPFKLKGTYKEYLDKEKTDLGSYEEEELTGLNFKEEKIFLTFGYVTEKDDFVPHLKPLGDLTKDVKTCDEINEFLEPNGLEINNFLLLKNSLNAVAISWEEMQNVLNILYREHYDVFGLINKRLAVSLHDVV